MLPCKRDAEEDLTPEEDRHPDEKAHVAVKQRERDAAMSQGLRWPPEARNGSSPQTCGGRIALLMP